MNKRLKNNLLLFLLFFFISCSFLFAADTLTITTYYPSPYGVYKTLRLYPTDICVSGNPCSDEGELCFNNTLNALLICRGTTTLAWAGVGSGSSTDWSLTGNDDVTSSDFIGTTNNTNWIVKTNNTERMRILGGSGKVGIGGGPTGNPDDATLQVIGTARNNDEAITYGRVTNCNGIGNTCYGIYAVNNDTPPAQDYGMLGSAYNARGVSGNGSSIGVLGIGTDAGAVAVYGDVLGPGQGVPPAKYDFYASGPGIDYGCASSIRWKKNIRPIDSALGKVLKLRGVYFDWDNEHGAKHDFGMIAEEVGKLFPEAVVYETDSKYATGMDYSRLTAVLVEAVKDMQKEIGSLKKETRLLKKKALKKPKNRQGSLTSDTKIGDAGA